MIIHLRKESVWSLLHCPSPFVYRERRTLLTLHEGRSLPPSPSPWGPKTNQPFSFSLGRFFLPLSLSLSPGGFLKVSRMVSESGFPWTVRTFYESFIQLSSNVRWYIRYRCWQMSMCFFQDSSMNLTSAILPPFPPPEKNRALKYAFVSLFFSFFSLEPRFQEKEEEEEGWGTSVSRQGLNSR